MFTPAPPVPQRERITSPRNAVRTPHKIRFTPAEWARIVERARETGRAPARYVREVALGRLPRTRRRDATAPLVRELGRIGNTLVELAASMRHASSDADCSQVDDRVQQTLTELLDAVRGLR